MALDIPIKITITPDQLKASEKDIIRSLNKIEREAKETGMKVERSFGKGFKGMLAGLKKLRAGWVALAGVISGGVIAGMAAMTDRALRLNDSITKVADRVGFTAEQLQALRFASEQSGVAVSTFDMAMQRFARRIGEVDKNTGELLKTAQQYNIEVRDSEGNFKTQIELLREWADVIKNAESEQERLSIAFKLFDSEGARLVELMRQGAEGIDAFAAEAERLGIVIDEDILRNSVKAVDAINRLRRQLTALFNSVVAENAERIAAAVQSIVEWIARQLPETPMSKAEKDVRRLEAAVEDTRMKMEQLAVSGTDPAMLTFYQNIFPRLEEEFGKAQDRLTSLREEQERLNRASGFDPLAGGGMGAGLSQEESQKILDSWEMLYRDRFGIHSRSVGAEIELEKQAAEEQERISRESNERRQQELDRAQNAELDSWRVLWNRRLEVNAESWETIKRQRAQATEETEMALKSFFAEVDEAESKLPEMLNHWTQLSEAAAKSMHDNFSNFFFDSMRGEFDSLADYADAVLRSIQRAVADIAAQQLIQNLFGTLNTASSGGGVLQSLLGNLTGALGVGGSGSAASGGNNIGRTDPTGLNIVNNFAIQNDSPLTRQSSLQAAEDMSRTISML